MSNTYLAFYQCKQVEVQADSAYNAQIKGVAHFKPPLSKRHMVHVQLAEKDGTSVNLSTSSL